jgi:hypothetical protein
MSGGATTHAGGVASSTIFKVVLLQMDDIVAA